ncbi:NmrA family transcriptional regulator [Metarhizium rileyi]|uniref:NmrA family transcriptional regulator n=1 Tax=Metarhizium rileyi (strain RCEF 4871) TaxID=1649241 RepID=A0A162JNR8_METRR|nr:NmrA family transcriptional regulator [Metarhizium rileyi RCEF 4871]
MFLATYVASAWWYCPGTATEVALITHPCNQGGSVINSVINDVTFRQGYKVRKVTLEVSTPATKRLLQQDVEVVTGNADDTPSVRQAFKGLTQGHFDCNARVEKYVRKLPIKGAFFAPGSFMQNLTTSMRPITTDDGTYVLATGFTATKLLLTGITNTVKLYPVEEIVSIISKSTAVGVQAASGRRASKVVAS